MIAPPDNPLQDFTDFDRKVLLPGVFKDHANYKLELEVLSRIPLLPIRLDVWKIAYDLDVTDSMIESAIDRLRLQGFRLQTWPVEKGLQVGHSISSWDKGQEIAGRYYADVYGSWGCSAVVADKEPRR